MAKDEEFVQIGSAKFPKRILEKLDNTGRGTETLLTSAEEGYQKQINGSFRFQMTSSAPKDILEPSERSAFHSFLAKLRSIPDFPEPSIVQQGEQFFLGNEPLAKHIVTEFRPIIFNQTDSIFYGKIQGIVFPMLNRADPAEGTKITVLNENNEDITELFKKEFAACRKVLDRAVQLLDLDYLYNGVLQHSDQRFSMRYSEDFHSGNLQYIFLKNAHALTYLKHYLRPFEHSAALFWYPGYPRPGAL